MWCCLVKGRLTKARLCIIKQFNYDRITTSKREKIKDNNNIKSVLFLNTIVTKKVSYYGHNNDSFSFLL